MRCPFCGNTDTQVKDSRPAEDHVSIRRRRFCPACGGRFTTYERVQLRDLVVIKSNGRREDFDRAKLERSVRIALQKRPVEPERIDQMVSGIVRRLESMGETDIPSKVIGEIVMEALARIDTVAYVRFASVYRNFQAADDFDRFVAELRPRPGRRLTAEADARFMRLALTLGRRGLGRVWPNPAVGCVIVAGGRIVGRGATAPGGRPHAETEALRMAGAAARGRPPMSRSSPAPITGTPRLAPRR